MADAPDTEPPDEIGEELTDLSMGFVPPPDSMAQIAEWLDVEDPDTLSVVTEVLDDRTLFATGSVIRDIIDELDDPVGGGLEGFGAPRWFPFDTRDALSIVPLVGWFGVPEGTLGEGLTAVALRIFLGQLGPTLEVVAAPGQLVDAGRVLAAFNERRKARNPLKRKLLRVGGGPNSLNFRVADPPKLTRADVVLPPGGWDQIDRTIFRPLLTATSPRLRSVLGAHTAVLIHGAAGTGKTTLCRVLAAELNGQATVIYVEPATGRDALVEVYASAQDLAPALVVIEHAEAAAPARGTDMPLTLVQFAAAFDLAQASRHPIVTLLTTTEPTAIDASFRQSSRLDLTLHLPVPDHPLRREILGVLLGSADGDGDGDGGGVAPGEPALRPIHVDVELDAIARVTDGATGSDLQHLVRLAVLEALAEGDPAEPAVVSTPLLRRLAAARGWAGTDTGMYL